MWKASWSDNIIACEIISMKILFGTWEKHPACSVGNLVQGTRVTSQYIPLMEEILHHLGSIKPL